ncbi:MAG: GNAT family N-acetyltransferase [Candidatus Aenigmarchaeota archaeon]|nr:GNAT family N-acetyltransferase [Candidatus Aenigmarchaeota archaeon]
MSFFSREGLIYSIAVRSDRQNEGMGSMLMQEALRRLRRKTRKVWLQTRISNVKARTFFEKFGFKPVLRIKNYYGDEDGILLVSDLASPE